MGASTATCSPPAAAAPAARIVGGPGRDDASFAETQAHPGLLIISFPQGKAWIDVVRGCNPVRLAGTNEDMEGSFD